MRYTGLSAGAVAAFLVLACSSDKSGDGKGDSGAQNGGTLPGSGGTGGVSGGGAAPPVTGAVKPACLACEKPSSLCSATPPAAGTSRAAQLVAKLGKSHFMIGMGNDLNADHTKDGAYTIGVTLDVHYAYLSGLPGIDGGGWPDWDPDGSFVDKVVGGPAVKNCVAPMFSVYGMAARGDGNLQGLGQDDYMTSYWKTAKLMFQRIAMMDRPTIVHVEPDFWGYAMQQSGFKPETMKVLIGGRAPDCSTLPETLVGLGKCWSLLARKYAPKALIGFHSSEWGGTPDQIVTFFKAIGVADTDVMFVEALDRDAGCFEAGKDPNCGRTGKFYWDESNQTSPNFHEHLAYAKKISDGVGKPLLWWQVPFGVPSNAPGGTPGHYRDNRVHYIFSHIDEFVAAGGAGVLFGTGVDKQTDWTTDGGQFKNAATTYFQNPVRLP